MTDRPLTTKQRLFVEAYLANPNATEAARAARYKGNDKTLAQVGAENLRKPYLSALIEARVETAIITADEILNDVKVIAKNAKRDGDKLKAYEMLGKHLAMWIDRTDHSGEVANKIVVEFTKA